MSLLLTAEGLQFSHMGRAHCEESWPVKSGPGAQSLLNVRDVVAERFGR